MTVNCIVCGRPDCCCHTTTPNVFTAPQPLQAQMIETAQRATQVSQTLSEMIVAGFEPGFIESALITASGDLIALRTATQRLLDEVDRHVDRARARDNEALKVPSNVAPLRRAA